MVFCQSGSRRTLSRYRESHLMYRWRKESESSKLLKTLLSSSLDGSTVASSERKVDIPEAAIVQPRPQNDVPTLADTSTLEGKSRTAEPAPIGSPGPAEALPPRPKTTSPVLQSAPKPALSSESQPVARVGWDVGKGNELQHAGALASFVAIQGNDLLKDVAPPERRGPEGYITVESKPELIRNAPGRNRSKPPEPRAKSEQDPAESPNRPLKIS